MRRLRPLALLLPAALLLGAAGAGVSQRYAVEAGSRFRIDGTSTVGTWRCAATEIDGAAHVPEAAGARVTAEVTVGVRSFDCGVARMNHDFREALRVGEHPSIRFVLDGAEVLAPEARPGAWVPVRVTGRLRLAGAERPVAIAAEGQRLGQGRVRVRGTHALRMTDFGVDPPTGMLGLVRARDNVTVAFDLNAAAR